MFSIKLNCLLLLTVTLNVVIIQSLPAHEISIKCEIDKDQRGTEEYFIYISCDLSHDKVSSEVNFDELRESNQVIKVKFNGNQNYPESMPSHLGKSIEGVGNFYYQNSPLKHVKRSDFKDMKALLTLIDISSNQIEDISHDAFHDLPNLSYVSIENNKIKTLHSDTFKFAPQLTTFVMRNNQINELHPDLFKHSPYFYVIYAEYNQIIELSGELFVNNPHMEVVSMRHNLIENVEINFCDYKNLTLVDLRENKDECDVVYAVRSESFDEKEMVKVEKELDNFQKRIDESCVVSCEDD